MNAVLESPEKVWTYEDYLALNDDTVFEIINGKALMSPAPELFHQRWAGKLYQAILHHIEAHKLGEIFFAPVDVVLDEKNIVQPDLVFVSTANSSLLERRGVMGAPDLVVEIILPTSLRRDRYDKRELYARFGVKEFWLADVANRSIEILSLLKGAYQLFSCATNEGKIQSAVLPGFELDLASLD
ncbi:MAG TPA: Uma2 family endonuclease [Verrucomicrobiota bacterium]|nr:Uma2 family endonuclease [Verrucomicrobiota bacterium]